MGSLCTRTVAETLIAGEQSDQQCKYWYDPDTDKVYKGRNKPANTIVQIQ